MKRGLEVFIKRREMGEDRDVETRNLTNPVGR